MSVPLAVLWNGLLDLVYPPCCLVCRARLPEGALCAVCQDAFPPVLPPYCDRCGTPVPAGCLVCDLCEKGDAPEYSWAQAMGLYSGTLLQAIHRLKYDGKTALAAPLGHLLSRSLDTPSPLLPPATPAFDLVVPVPLHASRVRHRGFNQAEKIARVLAQERGWKLDIAGLRRIRSTKTQTRLNPAERAANVRGAFAARTPDYFAGRSVLLVDDVLTTTATVRECARVLRGAGASRVCVVVLARAV